MAVKIIPALNAGSEKEFFKNFSLIEKAAVRCQIDVCDGSFTQHKNWHDAEKIKQIKSRVSFDVHLMTDRPDLRVKHWSNLPSVASIAIHAETLPLEKKKEWKKIADTGKEIVLALSPGTPISILANAPAWIKKILILGVNPGASGQAMDSETENKIKQIKKNFPRLKIIVDGGINEKNLIPIIQSRVDEICVSSAIFASGDAMKNLNRIKKISREAKKYIK